MDTNEWSQQMVSNKLSQTNGLKEMVSIKSTFTNLSMYVLSVFAICVRTKTATWDDLAADRLGDPGGCCGELSGEPFGFLLGGVFGIVLEYKLTNHYC